MIICVFSDAASDRGKTSPSEKRLLPAGTSAPAHFLCSRTKRKVTGVTAILILTDQLYCLCEAILLYSPSKLRTVQYHSA